MADEVIIYCDESGNTGPNYVDPAQPFYVLAGWSVPVERLADVAAVVEETRQAHCPCGELKSNRLLRHPAGVRAAIDLFTQLGQLHCVPLYVVAEKRYCVAGKIVETFMDPLYNDRVRNPFIPDVITKKEIANTFYDHLPSDVFAEFADAYRNPTGDAFRTSLTNMVEAVRRGISPELAASVEGCRPHLDEIATAEADVTILGSVGRTFNLPALAAFLTMVEILGRLGLVSVRKIVHDEQAKYEEGYKKIFEIHKNSAEHFYVLPNGGTVVGPLKHIGGFELAASHKDPVLPAADILAGAVRLIFCRANDGSQPTADEIRLSEFILPPLLMPTLKLAWMIASNHLQEKLGKAFFAHYGLDETSTEGAIEVRSAQPLDAPVFPVREADDVVPGGSPGAKKVDLPLFTLIGTKSGLPMYLRMPVGRVGPGTDDGVLVLFSNRAAATDWLSSYEDGELTEEHRVAEFGVRELDVLIETLEAAMKVTNVILFDPGSEGHAFMDLSDCVGKMRRIYHRMIRIFSGGFDKEIVQQHEIVGKSILTILGSDGRYGALISQDGTIYFGKTREEALDALRAGEGL